MPQHRHSSNQVSLSYETYIQIAWVLLVNKYLFSKGIRATFIAYT